MDRKVIAAAVAAVGFWSLKPVFVTAIGDRAGYTEVFLSAGAVAVVASAIIMAVRHDVTRRAYTGTKVKTGVLNGAASGLFLGMWYYGFYRALQTAAKVDATIIAFTWPLLAVIFTMVLSPGTARPLRLHQWGLLALGFAGAAAIAIGGSTRGDSGPGIVWAFIAALGSGLYLPFAIRSADAFAANTGRRTSGTFHAISTANLTAVLAMVVLVLITGTPLAFDRFDITTTAIVAVIGLGTYLTAEIAWTWAFQEHKSLALSSLPYFSPAVSVILLHLIFGEPIGWIAGVGLVLIVGSNLLLHLRRTASTTGATG